MVDPEEELRKIRRRAREARKRDISGRYDYESSQARTEVLNCRLTEGERDMLRHVAAASGQTVTATVVRAVNYYATMIH